MNKWIKEKKNLISLIAAAVLLAVTAITLYSPRDAVVKKAEEYLTASDKGNFKKTYRISTLKNELEETQYLKLMGLSEIGSEEEPVEKYLFGEPSYTEEETDGEKKESASVSFYRIYKDGSETHGALRLKKENNEWLIQE